MTLLELLWATYPQWQR